MRKETRSLGQSDSMLADFIERLMLRFESYLLDPNHVSPSEEDIYFNREYVRPASDAAMRRIAELERQCDQLRRENADLKSRGPFR